MEHKIYITTCIFIFVGCLDTLKLVSLSIEFRC